MSGLHTKAYKRLVAGLATARVDAGITQRALAAQLGVDHAYVAKYEGARQRLDVIEYLRVCQAIGCDPVALIELITATGQLD